MSKREVLRRENGVTLTKVSLIDGDTGQVADSQYVVYNERAPLESQDFGNLEDALKFFEAELLRGSPSKKQNLG
jgi:hypothetical protein